MRFWPWLCRLFAPWILTILVVFVSSVTFAYDCQTQTSTAYDCTNKQVLRYDTDAVLAANESLNQLTGGSAFFATFAKFLAADTGALKLNIFGEGEAPGFLDVSPNSTFANGRPLTSCYRFNWRHSFCRTGIITI